MDPVEVTARFDLSGDIIPLEIAWQRHRYRVASTGRSWQDARGVHILVMLPNQQVVELVFDATTIRWYLHPLDAGRQVV